MSDTSSGRPASEVAEHTRQWMREVTEEVARLTEGSDADTQRREALEKRLADLEDRIGSLLTLTELVSLNDNPFVEPNAEKASKASAAEPAPEPAPAEASGERTGRPPPAAQSSPEPEPSPKTAPAPAEPAAALHPNDAAAEPHEQRISMETPEGPPQPRTDEATPSDAPAPAPTRATPEPPSVAAEPQEGRLLPDGTHSYDDWHEEGTPPAPGNAEANVQARPDPTRRRLVEVEWAALLARAGRDLDLGGFLGFYVEAGWIDRPTAARVRSLTDQFVRNGAYQGQDWDLHDLHVRSIVLLGHGTHETAASTPLVDEVVRTTRAVANRRWIHPSP